MAEENVTELAEANLTAQDMDLETIGPDQDKGEDEDNGVHLAATNGNANSKRVREYGAEDEGEEEAEDGLSKKQRVDKSVEEERLEELGEGGEGDKAACRVGLGPKHFESSVEMFDYFYKFLHYWPPNLNVNKYEHMVLMDLLKKGHPEPDKKIREGINGFQVRYHPLWKSRCFFLIRVDDSVDDFSFRKCVDHILPLPEEMKFKPNANKAFDGGSGKGHSGKGGGRGGRGGGRGRGRGRGRGGRPRN